MTKKQRFEYDYRTGRIYDNESDWQGTKNPLHWVTRLNVFDRRYKQLEEENEQLKQDNAELMKLLRNQSTIIQKLHSKLLEYQVQEPIILTKKDLKLMDEAISYYTHGRCPE